MKKLFTKEVRALALLFLMCVLILSPLSTVFASDGIPIERDCSLVHEHEGQLSELDEVDEYNVETKSYLVCPECDRGRISRRNVTVVDYQIEYYSHGKCNINGKHYQCWYVDWRILECDTCNYYNRTVISPDYGWWCQMSRP